MLFNIQLSKFSGKHSCLENKNALIFLLNFWTRCRVRLDKNSYLTALINGGNTALVYATELLLIVITGKNCSNSFKRLQIKDLMPIKLKSLFDIKSFEVELAREIKEFGIYNKMLRY